jgi:hypothetical protein
MPVVQRPRLRFRTVSSPLLVALLSLPSVLITSGDAAGSGSDLATVVVSNTLPGFVPTAPGPTNGPLTQSNAYIFGSGSAVIGRDLGSGLLSGYVRTWGHVPPNGDAVVIFVVRPRDLSQLGSFVAGVKAAQHGATSFPVPGLADGAGFTMRATVLGSPATQRLVVFAKGDFAFLVGILTVSGDLTSTSVINVAQEQAANISGGAPEPTCSGCTSGFYRAGGIFGAALLVVFILGVILILTQRQRRRRMVPIAPAVPAAPRITIPPPLTGSYNWAPPPSTGAVEDRPVGWYVNPEHLSEERYWDGQSWTARRRPTDLI